MHTGACMCSFSDKGGQTEKVTTEQSPDEMKGKGRLTCEKSQEDKCKVPEVGMCSACSQVRPDIIVTSITHKKPKPRDQKWLAQVTKQMTDMPGLPTLHQMGFFPAEIPR